MEIDKSENSKAAEDLCKAVGASIAQLVLVAVWLCIDDKVSEISGVDWVGQIGFWQWYAATMVVSYLTRLAGQIFGKSWWDV